MNNQNVTTTAKEGLDLMSVQNWFHALVKSQCVLGTNDYIMVNHDN